MTQKIAKILVLFFCSTSLLAHEFNPAHLVIDELIENGADSILEVLTKNETSIIKKEIEKRIIEHRIVSYNELKKIVNNLLLLKI